MRLVYARGLRRVKDELQGTSMRLERFSTRRNISDFETNQDLTAEIVKVSVFCEEYPLIWLHAL